MIQDKKSGNGEANPAFPFAGIMPDMQKLMMVGPHMQAAMLKAVIDQQKELFSFLRQRCDEDMKLAQRIGSASSMGDVYSACIGFCKDAATQYAAEASKITEISSQDVIEVAHDFQRQRSEARAAIREPETA